MVREGHMKIRAPKDFWSGVMFCGFAAIAIAAARGYSLGSAGKMGPGYFPLLLGFVLAALGAVLIARSVVVDDEPLPRFYVLPLVVIAAAAYLFMCWAFRSPSGRACRWTSSRVWGLDLPSR